MRDGNVKLVGLTNWFYMSINRIMQLFGPKFIEWFLSNQSRPYSLWNDGQSKTFPASVRLDGKVE